MLATVTRLRDQAHFIRDFFFSSGADSPAG
jgi:hypothetical protein